VAFSFALNITIMNILELDSYNLGDAVKFNDQLNPRIWQGNKMQPEVRAKLLQIAEDFKQSLGLTDLNVKDITLSGSNAGYTYTPHSDIDLHLVVDLPEADASAVYRELFDAKKFQYNETHNIKIGGYDVELYVENANKSAVSQGIFSVLNDDWIKIPLKKRATINDNVVKNKYDVIKNHIESAIESGDLERLTNTAAKIKKMRQAGLDRNGELGPENLAYKMLRSQGVIKKLYDARTAAKDHELSLRERTIQVKKPFRYGFRTTEDVSSNPSGVSPETKMFLSEKPARSQQEVVTDFVNYCVEQLSIEQLPTIKFKRDPEWSARNKTFGRYNHETNLLEVSLAGRHIMDILRTVAHELTHQRQHEVANVPDHAGETGSEWENEANAKAGVLMREYAQQHPEYFADESLEESSGYIPTKKQANDPRFKMALTKDIRPGAIGKEANKLNLHTDSQGRPALLMKTANQMHEDLANEFKWELALMETEILGEINMSTGSLRQEAAKTGAIAGMEFEMIVPNVEGGDDGDWEADYSQDQGVSSIQDVYDFFYDGDYNSRGDVSRLRDRMQDEYYEWLSEAFDTRWDSDESEFVYNYLKENASTEEIAEILGIELDADNYPDTVDRQAYLDATDKVVEASYGNYWYDAARETAQEDFNQNADLESDWLESRDLNTMQDIEGEYDISWPHWEQQGGGEASIQDIAQEFENAIDRPVQASGNYHSGSVRRPSPTAQHYVVEPDGSLEADDSNDVGLEFVSPPLPIDDILSDLNKVKQWAKVYGCYTNDSTGLHINISVPGYSRENLDFVKLALLMGDKYVLDLFGRAGNTYAKSALDMVKGKVRNDPDSAQQLLEKMKGNLDSLASKAIHSGVTSKYTSINTKDGHIEFRSPGGDWLDENFDQIENTLLRFTVAMSAALNPAAYREEYLKKLYKLLTEDNKDDSDTIRYFSEYVAGKIPKAALRSFVKQAQLTRQIKRGTTGDKKMWWRVGRPGYGASAEVVATTKDEAIALGKKEYPDWASAKDMTATPLRPYEEAEPTPEEGNWGIWIRANDRFANQPGSYSRSETPPLMRFPSRAAAELWIEQQRATRPNMRSDIEVREIEPAATEPQGADTSATGQWKVIDSSGREIYRFRPAHNTRAKANELAAMWAREYNWDSNYQVEPAEDTTSAVVEIPYEIYNRQTGEVVDTTQLRNDDEAQIRLDDYRSHGPHRLNREQAEQTFGIRRGPGVTNTQTDTNPLRPTGPGPWEVASRSNNQVYFNPPSTYRRNAESEARTWLSQNGHNPNEFEVRTRQGASNADAASQSQYQYTSTPIPGVQDVELDIPIAQRTFTGEWRVVLPSGEEVYRFSGVGNNQGDANRVAAQWLRTNGMGVSGEGFEVLPVMNEEVI
jgi:hypothetical protein